MSNLDWYLRSNLKMRHLQLIVALDDIRNVGRVSNYLSVSQPAVSKALSTLERGLGVRLFDRTSHGVTPTQQGENFVRYARQVIETLASARIEMQAISQGRVTRVALGTLPAAAPLTSQFIASLDNEVSDVAVSIHEATTEYLFRMLRAGDIDLLVGNLPAKPLGIEFESELLYKDPIIIAIGPHHPLLKKDNISWDMLSLYPMVLPPKNTVIRVTIEEALIKNGVDISQEQVESLSTMTNYGILHKTNSIGFFSKKLMSVFLEQKLLATVSLSLKNVHIEMGLVWMTDRGLTKSQEKVRKLFFKAAAEI